jgi:hypothetical protein
MERQERERVNSIQIDSCGNPEILGFRFVKQRVLSKMEGKGKNSPKIPFICYIRQKKTTLKYSYYLQKTLNCQSKAEQKE